MASNPFYEFGMKYGPAAGEEGPLLFVVEVLHVTPDKWQADVLRAYGRGERRISIAACHGPGKTAVAAWLVIYNFFCLFPQRTVATAPSSTQLHDVLVAEVKLWIKRMPAVLQECLELKSDRIELIGHAEASYFSARTARAETPEALQGVHMDSGQVLLIADEASGVPEPIFESAAGSMSGHNCTTLLLSNPTRSSGFFFDTHHSLRDMWFCVKVSAFDSPRVTEDFIEDMARRYGVNSNAYRIRVLGEFPLADQDTIIPFEFVHSARHREIDIPPGLAELLGLDVARFGDDENVLIRRNRLACLPLIETWQGKDLMHTTGRLKNKWEAYPLNKRPQEILIDVIGLGAGVVDRAIELKMPARGINVSESAALKDEYANLRAELWFVAREWLSHRDRVMPLVCTCTQCANGMAIAAKKGKRYKNHAEQLQDQLTAVRFDYTNGGKLIVEPKKEYKKRTGESPNLADAFILTFASDPATLLHGSSGDNSSWNVPWNEPIHRRLSVV